MSTRRRSESTAVRVAVLASGAGSTFDALLQAHHAGALDVEICLLIASRDEAEAITVARSHGIAHVTLDEKHLGHDAVDEAMLTALSTHRIDLIVLAGYTRKIGRRTLAAYSRRIINTHPAPLPRFGGTGMYGEHVHRAVLESGVTESAATVHLVDAEYDTGPVIAARSVAVKPGDDVGALRARVQIAERALLIQTLNDWATGTSSQLPRFSGGGASGAASPADTAATPLTKASLMSTDAVAQLQELVGTGVVGSRFVSGGYTPTSRWLVQLDDGRSVFVKHAVHDSVVARLRVEHEAYRQLRAPWLPRMVAYQDGEHPMLVLEDLSGCEWPPPWDAARVAAVRRTLDDVARHPVPADLRTIGESGYAEGGWPAVAEDPEPFLALRLCTRRWLDAALPRLLDAADPALLAGDKLCHLDVRSDNLCFRADGGAVLIDWDCAAVGNPEFDLAFWLPSLHLEDGPAPESVTTITPGIVALVAGFFASEAGLPQIPEAPGVRGIQRRQLQVALPWAAHALQLEPPVAA